MTLNLSNLLFPGRRALVLAAALACALLSAPAAAHTRVERSSPADGDTARAAVTELRLRFTRPVESELTTITLFRGTTQVAAGASKVGEEGREFLLALPAALPAGDYVARWKTVGGDGHVLEGSWRFAVAAADPVVAAADSAAGAAGVAQTPPAPTTDGTDDALQEEVGEAGRPLAVAVRWAWFVSLLGMIGTVAFRYGVLPRLDRDPALHPVAARSEAAVWFVALGAAALSVAALFARLWMQVAALGGGSEGAWDGARLDLLLRQTGWGLAWVLQAIATLAFVTGLFIARAPHGRGVGWMGAGAGAVLLAAVPALSGHAASVGRMNGVAIFADTVHVLGAGVWLGTLAAILAVGIPAAIVSGAGAAAGVAAMVRAFSPMALAGAAVVGVTGVVNVLFQLDTVPDLWTTGYGRALLLKVALLAGVAALGFYNWRRVLPALGDDPGTARLRTSARAELGVGLVVLLVTAVLVALPTP